MVAPPRRALNCGEYPDGHLRLVPDGHLRLVCGCDISQTPPKPHLHHLDAPVVVSVCAALSFNKVVCLDQHLALWCKAPVRRPEPQQRSLPEPTPGTFWQGPCERRPEPQQRSLPKPAPSTFWQGPCMRCPKPPPPFEIIPSKSRHADP